MGTSNITMVDILHDLHLFTNSGQVFSPSQKIRVCTCFHDHVPGSDTAASNTLDPCVLYSILNVTQEVKY